MGTQKKSTAAAGHDIVGLIQKKNDNVCRGNKMEHSGVDQFTVSVALLMGSNKWQQLTYTVHRPHT